MHSRCSHDARDPVDAICREAIAKGLSGIALTDHIDIDSGRRQCFAVLDSSSREIALARERYGEKLEITLGMEIAEMDHDPTLASELTSRKDVGFVLASLHRLRGESDFYYIDYSQIDLDDMIERYYAELLEIVESADFDSLAHVNYMVRYMEEKERRIVDFSSHFAALEDVLRCVAERGRALEYNTSSGKSFASAVPTPDVFKLFRRVGGEAVTIGSDSHTAAGIGWRATEAARDLRDLGFKYASFYKDRKPIFYEL